MSADAPEPPPPPEIPDNASSQGDDEPGHATLEDIVDADSAGGEGPEDLGEPADSGSLPEIPDNASFQGDDEPGHATLEDIVDADSAGGEGPEDLGEPADSGSLPEIPDNASSQGDDEPGHTTMEDIDAADSSSGDPEGDVANNDASDGPQEPVNDDGETANPGADADASDGPEDPDTTDGADSGPEDDDAGSAHDARVGGEPPEDLDETDEPAATEPSLDRDGPPGEPPSDPSETGNGVVDGADGPDDVQASADVSDHPEPAKPMADHGSRERTQEQPKPDDSAEQGAGDASGTSDAAAAERREQPSPEPPPDPGSPARPPVGEWPTTENPSAAGDQPQTSADAPFGSRADSESAGQTDSESTARDETDGVDRDPGLGEAGFDPGKHRGALETEFRPGVEDPRGLFDGEDRDDGERKMADRLASEGWHIAPREADHTYYKLKNPDAMVRRDSADEGTVTDFKCLRRNSPNAVKRNVIEGGEQVDYYGGGDVVIDGRDVGLDAATARRGYVKAVGQARQHGQSMPDNSYFILGDNTMLKIEYER
ncbi:hypothetical protein [Streptomyces ureilyticus]|uniref:Uncharacterized protein n=1 Tax=Streptomyces ureilyticus TaxID=1775131 RepID=A0ABX0E380_9ACTN|nr:hypothetical protein [Streptomyces ureilyticus]NGO47289.1 hypothetical protein [Streptomyces ureilyticus]